MADPAEEEGTWTNVKRAVTDSRGRVSWPRITNALRGRATSDVDLIPWFGVGLLAALTVGPAFGYVDQGTVGAAVDTLVIFLILYLVGAGSLAANRIEEYYENDEEVAFSELQARYADGDIDLAEFQRRVDRVFEQGPGVAFDQGTDGDDHAGGSGVAAGNPVAILRERFARGEIDEAEYRRRITALRETASGAGTARMPPRAVDAQAVGTGSAERETDPGTGVDE